MPGQERLVKIGQGNPSKFPLCVDLDRTLLRTDCLHEAIVSLLKSSPLSVFLLPFILVRGRAFLKSWLASKVTIDAEFLPYNSEVIELIKRERSSGRKIVLATASNLFYAQAVADHLDLFDEIVASDEGLNLKGGNKKRVLDEKFGAGRYGYVGDSTADIPIWLGCAQCFVVSNSEFLVSRIKDSVNAPVFQLKTGSPSFRSLLRALRVHQWVKNLLLFVPLFLAHKVFVPELLWSVVKGFCAFSLCASAVYLLNDLLDLPSDRRHPRKRTRPFASGELSIVFGLVLAPALLVFSFGLSISLGVSFLYALVAYFVTTTAYSLYLKQIVVLDIVVLAALYTVRILAGGVAAGVLVSQWLLAFSMFFFLSLACVKRFSELFALRLSNGDNSHGRGYKAADLEQIGSLGSAAGYISVLVLTLFISSGEVRVLYSRPEMLWLIAPLLLYWISRVWILAHRGDVHEDPIVFALHDRVSYLVGLLALLVVVLSA